LIVLKIFISINFMGGDVALTGWGWIVER